MKNSIKSGLIRFVTNKTQSNIIGYFLCALLFIRLNFSTFCLHHGFHAAFLTGIRTRNSLMGLIYKKVKKKKENQHFLAKVAQRLIYAAV